ncbi:MAG: ABC transporter permease subunit [Nitrospina sp.]|nr:ABC transporter permease subunit [Nitrospina sp.]MBT3414950.1 ABC transporter permease subunit [Nitrospina sp.]MBT3857855.1 ABC transporter permease subunit [Nitrospina sp.]MBT4105493.1 ABC transporter permease subunit [Nitrospina sp.]MBT4390911.1 ABC transporter permease subunit [Nitrospina sp.]
MNAVTVEKTVLAFIGTITFLIVLLLVFILGALFVKGMPAFHAGFLFEESRDFGLSGGIFYQAVGTLILMTTAVLWSLPVALGSVLFQTEYLSGKFKTFLTQLTYILNATPTILFGLVGYLFFGEYLGVSWVTGSLILAVMILPTLQVSIREAVEALPEKYREAGMALGLSRPSQIRRIILPQCFYGIVTGVLLGLARAAGETAAIMFTATTFSGIQLPQSFSDPVPTLQTHILVLAQEAANPQSLAQAWGAGLVLLGLVFMLTLTAWAFRTRVVMESEQ